MNPRIINTAVPLLCLALLWAVFTQQRHVTRLRVEKQQVMDGFAPADANVSDEPATRPAAAASPELLRLRNEVAQLTARRKELATVRTENERLQARVAERATNAAVARSVSYLRKSDAQFAGYNTPENTMQTVLWAIQNRDITSLTQAFSSEMLEHMPRDGQHLFDDADKITGLTILGRTQMPDGSVQLEIMDNRSDAVEKVPLFLINGQWRIGEPKRD